MKGEKILISACLAGQAVRYNGSAKTLMHPCIEQWRRERRLCLVCPEVSGGLSTPRLPAEIMRAQNGEAVLDGGADVLNNASLNVTEMFIHGAYAALRLAQQNNCRFALLTDSSPSCGSQFIYDGSFSAKKHFGNGVTAALLKRHNIQVFSEIEVDKLYQLIG